jgi:methionine biosynthesis protein MetW
MSTVKYYEDYWSPGGFQPLGKPTATLERVFHERLGWARNCLDIGCGDGATVGLIAQRVGLAYEGVDVSEAAVGLAKQNGFSARAVERSDSLPFADWSFDVVCLVEVLEHLFDPLGTLREAHRVLVPQGAVVVSVPNIAYWRRRMDLFVLGRWNPLGDELSIREPWRDPHIRFFTPKIVERLLVAAGFRMCTISGDHGSLLRDIPWLRKAWKGPNRTYALFQRAMPSLLGYRIVAVAEKIR